MFNYYGSKSRFASKYPEPKFDTIIEPFAGGAHYSFRYHDRKIILVEKNTDIAGLWKWLINEATEEKILELQEPERGEDIVGETHYERLLVSLHCVAGGVNVRKRAGTMEGSVKAWPGKKKRLAASLDRIRHWSIIEGDYKDLPNVEATWFIDPPYQKGGNFYPTPKLDYNELAAFSLSRNGQIIVCEANGADWLPFETFHHSKTIHGKRTEVIYVR